MGAGAALWSLGQQARTWTLWALFKLVQAVVAASFSFIIVLQAALRGVGRLIGGEPPELLKVQAAQAALRERRAAATTASRSALASGDEAGKPGKGPGMIHLRAVAPDSLSEIKPMLVFNEPEQGHESEAWQLVGPFMRQYGRHAIANSQLFNPEYIHFFMPGVGSLPFICADIYNCVVISAVGDPLTHESQWRSITEAFLRDFPKAYFYHASDRYAALLHDMGYYINDVGAETTLQVQSWTYSNKTRTVRAAARAAREAGVRVRELQASELTPEMRQRLRHEISSDWLQQKAVADRELRVFVRNVHYDHIELRDGVRIFVAEAYADAAAAPPAVVDLVLQGSAVNAKPPKPPRASRLKGSGSGLSRTNSVLTAASSTSSLASMSTLGKSPSLASVHAAAAAGAAGSPSAAAAVAAATAEAAAAASPCTPFAAPEAAAQAMLQQQHDAQPVAAQEPQLVGFVLLDPLWEGGEPLGYVSSIVRMTRSAHQGTLKLLYEDIVSRLRQEGRRELAFGFAPFFNVQDDLFPRYITWMRWTALYLYHCANNVYAFQNLAFSKIRYGAGLTERGDAFRDPNVALTHIYMGNKSCLPGWSIVDLYVICMYVGFMDTVVDTWLKLTGIRKGGANLGGGAGGAGGMASAPLELPGAASAQL